MTDAAGTRDTVLLAHTRYPNAYGVPLVAFVPAVVVASLAFVFLRSAFALLPRLVLCGGAFGGVMFGMWRLGSWETRWFHVVLAWADVRARALLAAATRRAGGTTYEPLPRDLLSDRAALRDHAGL